MHRISGQRGDWQATPDEALLSQSPAPIVVLTAADTEIQTLAQGMAHRPAGAPPVRAAHLLNLQHPYTIDTYADQVLRHAQAIVLRLLGGVGYWPYGFQVLKDLVAETGADWWVLPGDGRPDVTLSSHSTVPLDRVDRLHQYFRAGGVVNLEQALALVAHHSLGVGEPPLPPQPLPPIGRLPWVSRSRGAKVGVVFYRAHALAGNTAAIEALCTALADRDLAPVPVFLPSFQEAAESPQLFEALAGVELLLVTTGFSLARWQDETPQLDLWQRFNIPVLQVVLAGDSQAAWAARTQGLTPRDMAMQVVLPEVDGRILSRAIGFKSSQASDPHLETPVVTTQPLADRVNFVAELAARWIDLRRTPPAGRRVALILANYPSRDGRLANGVGLDTPASCVALLQALRDAGYTLDTLPQDGNDLIALLTAGRTYDAESHGRPVFQSLDLATYCTWFATLPAAVQSGLRQRWGDPADQAEAGVFPVAGRRFGNIFVGLQPPRGYDLDPSLNYHAPDLEPPHAYLAFYLWVRQVFQAQAIAHVGKHGNLEWLPGKSVALSEACYPEVALGPLPHFYPFIVNDPGEGTQAKRRTQAVIIDHLTPPLTRAELHGSLLELEALLQEYTQAEDLDPPRLPRLQAKIEALIQREHLEEDLGWPAGRPLAEGLPELDAYLCDLQEAQIRNGLHILGACPTGEKLRDLVLALARHPSGGRPGLIQAIAQDLSLTDDCLSSS
ncbi:MAG: cobaltochelatase subunit CobN [Gloeomargaritaceae cyanobacterium C42_A2020_066]|nr:cobaltochelatase subunit CobN [Gloeomargaritaceae cyanobacterium C42_A2020_066]